MGRGMIDILRQQALPHLMIDILEDYYLHRRGWGKVSLDMAVPQIHGNCTGVGLGHLCCHQPSCRWSLYTSMYLDLSMNIHVYVHVHKPRPTCTHVV